MLDTRLVQTAVLGGPDSDVPVILPADHTDLDEFRSFHGTDKFWCGTLLNGCGRELVTKRYQDRICHFAHTVDADAGPSPCSRGPRSADHLYVARAGGRWLRSLGHEVVIHFVGSRHDEAVVLDTSHGAAVRFQLADLTREQWTAIDKQIRESGRRPTWLLSDADGEAELASYAADDPALLIRLQSDGKPALPELRVEVGTRTDSGAVRWDPLEECQIDEDGQIQTPTLRRRGQRRPERIVSAPDELRPPSVPWSPSVPAPRKDRSDRLQLNRAADRDAERVALETEAAETASQLRHLCSYKPPNLAVIRIMLSDAVILSRRVEKAGTRSELLEEAVKRATALAESPAATALAAEHSLGFPAALNQAVLILVGNLAKQALIQAACDSTWVPWRTLCHRMDRRDELGANEERIYQIMRIADTHPHGRRVPLLSALLVESIPPRPSVDSFYRIASDHGRTVPRRRDQLIQMRDDERKAAIAYWPFH